MAPAESLGVLSARLLARHPKKFLGMLKEHSGKIPKNSISYVGCWSGNLLMCLVYLTGKCEDEPTDSSYYGKGKSISPELAVEIFHLLLELGENPLEDDYYGENLFTLAKGERESSFCNRFGNELLLAEIEKLRVRMESSGK
jgi:hypothetical protein